MSVLEADLRERVLDASVALIEESGLGQLSMREVARRAGVSHQAPYHHFSDREAILAAIAVRGFERLREKLVEAGARAKNVGELLELSSIAYVTFACENPAYFRIMFRPELVDIEKHAEAEACADDAFSLVPLMIGQMMEAGFPSHIGSVDTMSTVLWSFVHGFACLLLDGPLAHKVPSFSTSRDRAIKQTARAFRKMVEATIEGAKSPAEAKRAKR